MKNARTPLIVAALLASLAGGTVLAQASATPAPQDQAQQPHRQGHGPKDPAQRQARFEQRMEALKQKLQITPTQEGAWNTFAQAMRPPVQPQRRPDREAIARMTTPERIDQLRAAQARRLAEMERRGEATKSFYATLTPEQKQTFDAQSLQAMRGRRGHGGHGQHG